MTPDRGTVLLSADTGADTGTVLLSGSFRQPIMNKDLLPQLKFCSGRSLIYIIRKYKFKDDTTGALKD